VFNYHQQNGSVVIEVAILYPIVILIILSVFSLAEMWVQENILQTAAQTAAMLCAQQHRDCSFAQGFAGDLAQDFTFVDYGVLRPYRYIHGNHVNETAVSQAILALVTDQHSFDSYVPIINIETKQYFTTKLHIVKLTKTFDFPVSMRFIGFVGTYSMEATGKAIVNDPAEFIRTADLAADILKRCDSALGVSDYLRDLFENVKEHLFVN